LDTHRRNHLQCHQQVSRGWVASKDWAVLMQVAMALEVRSLSASQVVWVAHTFWEVEVPWATARNLQLSLV